MPHSSASPKKATPPPNYHGFLSLPCMLTFRVVGGCFFFRYSVFMTTLVILVAPARDLFCHWPANVVLVGPFGSQKGQVFPHVPPLFGGFWGRPEGSFFACDQTLPVLTRVGSPRCPKPTFVSEAAWAQLARRWASAPP